MVRSIGSPGPERCVGRHKKADFGASKPYASGDKGAGPLHRQTGAPSRRSSKNASWCEFVVPLRRFG